MRQVKGRILSLPSQEGVPNLIVAAYNSKTTTKNIANRPRLGSLITGTSGSFELKFEEAGEDPGGVCVAVFAPEDVDPRTRSPRPMSSRLLYLSSVVLDRGENSEAFMIRIPQDLLAKHNLGGTVASDPQIETAAQKAANNILSATNATESIASKLDSKRKQIKHQNSLRRQKAITMASKINALPHALKSAKAQEQALVIVGKKNVGSLIDSHQATAIQKGLESMAGLKLPRPLKLTLSSDQLRRLGLGGTAKKASVSASTVASIIRQTVPSYDLVHPQPMPLKLLMQLQKRYLGSGEKTSVVSAKDKVTRKGDAGGN